MIRYALVLLLAHTTLSIGHPHLPLGARQAPNIPVNPNVAQEPWTTKYGFQTDLEYTGPLSFMHIEYKRCLSEYSGEGDTFDIGIMGMPFDTKTSYRPGARFGPFAIRAGSRRLSDLAYDFNYAASPRGLGAKILDCGDVPVSIFDPAKALDQMETAYTTMLQRPVRNGTGTNPDYDDRTKTVARDGRAHPRVVTLGGDHTIVLPILRALDRVYGPISVSCLRVLCSTK
ncbi:Arginase/deacetylase [Macrolepiota fuliginosa MF-IS2]|uniref:Arginase/deacetylase n=1 Tax=Macrolepiota fuliginosa MF-IS2 TaxID=1400762 RepID=A0A9P6BXW8_9AGAR|nr:Arginase/deacetylase [Macrolepiota fuliginosa MF-IS2]